MENREYKLTHYTTYDKPSSDFYDSQFFAFTEFISSCQEMQNLSTYTKVTLHAFDHLDGKYKLVGKLEK